MDLGVNRLSRGFDLLQLRALKLNQQSEAVRFCLIWFHLLAALLSGIAKLRL